MNPCRICNHPTEQTKPIEAEGMVQAMADLLQMLVKRRLAGKAAKKE